ncbi:MAG: branched-chain amino acid ABC transporter permease [Lutisporaceae bacterium]|jgi:branched-chain amino acid transport system permease protein
MTTFLSLTINGLAMGMVYALIAMGLVILVRAVGVMNFAQGDLLALGAYITCAFIVDVKLPFWAFIPVTLLCFAAIAIIFMFTCYWPLRKASYVQAVIVATIGASICIRELCIKIWGPIAINMPAIIQDHETNSGLVINLFGVNLQIQFLLTIGICFALILLVFLLFEKLYAGRMMEAAAQDKYAAELIGIPTIVTTMATYIIVVTIVSYGGFMIAPIYFVSTSLALHQLRAFAGVVIGGFGNIKGAVIGSVFVGLIEAYSSVWFSTYKDAVVFLILIVVLIFRPQGIFGEKIADKA